MKEKWWARAWFQATALFILFVAAYWVPLSAMVKIWYTDEDYSYGFLIPLVSAYIIWDKRKDLHTISTRTAWTVLPLLLLFVLVSIYGILGSSGNVSMPSLPILIILFTAFCFGIAAAKKMILPLGFLAFMVPVPAIIERTLGIFLKAAGSKMGGWLIGLFNISVHVAGNVIDIGVTQLQVVDACSGMRYLSALLALGVVYAYFFERVIWKRIACVILTIPIAVIMNGVRIGATGILAHTYGSKVAEGFFHGFSGYVFFVVAFACLFVVGRVLALFPPKGKAINDTVSAIQKNGDTRHDSSSGNTWKGFLVSVALLVIVGILSLNTGTLPPVKIQGGIQAFPAQIAEWTGNSQIVDQEIVIKSGAEESFSGNYKDSNGKLVSLYIGYRSTAFLANENFFHSPTVCLPSSGMQTVEETTRVIDNFPYFGKLKVTKMVMKHMGDTSLVYFWFQTKDKATHDKNINRFHLAMHAIRRDNTHDLFIRPITPIYPGESVEDAEKRMDGFVRDMMTTLLQFLKEKQVTQ
jgi:exosortase D (VPLPA-CTERM-specific)